MKNTTSLLDFVRSNYRIPSQVHITDDDSKLTLSQQQLKLIAEDYGINDLDSDKYARIYVKYEHDDNYPASNLTASFRLFGSEFPASQRAFSMAASVIEIIYLNDRLLECLKQPDNYILVYMPCDGAIYAYERDTTKHQHPPYGVFKKHGEDLSAFEYAKKNHFSGYVKVLALKYHLKQQQMFRALTIKPTSIVREPFSDEKDWRWEILNNLFIKPVPGGIDDYLRKLKNVPIEALKTISEVKNRKDFEALPYGDMFFGSIPRRSYAAWFWLYVLHNIKHKPNELP